MKSFLIATCAVVTFGSTDVAYSADVNIPILKARDQTITWSCKAYTSKPTVKEAGIIAVGLFETCDEPVKHESPAWTVGPYLSSIYNYRLDCKSRKYAYVNSQIFDAQFWKFGQRPSNASQPLLYSEFSTHTAPLFNEICNESGIYPRS